MLAAEAAFEALTGADGQGAEAPAVLSAFPQKFERSWVYEELHKARNFRPAFSKWGLYGAMLYGGIDLKLFGGRAPWTLHHRHADHECLKPAAEMPKIDYRSEEHTSELQSLMRISYAVFCLTKKKNRIN